MARLNPKTPSIAVACTDKGQHAWTALGDLSLHPGGSLVANGAAVYGDIATRRKDECVTVDDDHAGRVSLRCPRCGRHVQLTAANALKIVTAYWENDLPSLDIADL